MKLNLLNKTLTYLLGIWLLAISFEAQSQVAPVNIPAGGFNIDGALKAGNNIGDWLQGVGSGGFILNNSGNALNSLTTFNYIDLYDSQNDISFVEGSKLNDNPNTGWTWSEHKVPKKDDINHGLVHLTKDASNNSWIIIGADRLATNGDSHIDFEFLQNKLTRTGSGSTGGFSSEGPNGGRTVNDLLISVDFVNGGVGSGVFFFKWASDGAGSYTWRAFTPAAGTAFAATNSSAVDVPFGAFGNTTYDKNAFVEAAVNMNAVINAVQPCSDFSAKTLLIKTKASQSDNAELKDLIDPIQISLDFQKVTINLQDPLCINASPVTLTASPVGGTFSGDGISGNTFDPAIAGVGTHTITYSYSFGTGCVKTATTDIVVNSKPDVAIDAKGPSCIDASPITLTSSLTGGAFSGEGVTGNSFNPGIAGIGQHTITYSYTNTNGCSNSATTIVDVNENTLNVNGTKDDITCNGNGNGAIDITVSGAHGAVTYSWNDNNISEDRSSLATGDYSVTVHDAVGCSATHAFTINEPKALNASAVTANITTVNGNNGLIDLTVTGGTQSYTYKWNDGSTDEDRTNLSSGDYSVAITDAHGCSTNAQYTLTQPICNININGTPTDITCNGSANGAIDITVTGSNGTISYNWNDGSTDEDRTNLSAGNYSVTVKDETLCPATQSFTISEPEALKLSVKTTNISTVNGNDGSVEVTVTGGTKPYSFLWNDGNTDQNRTGLSAGTYSFAVTDAHGCTIDPPAPFTLTQPSCSLKISAKVTNICCYGSNTGAIDVSVTGNNGLVTYLWNDNTTGEDRANLIAGTYNVKATDAAACSINATFTVKQAKKLKVDATVKNVSARNKCDGSVTISASGGNAPYAYTWNDGYVGATRANVCKEAYTIVVKDSKGCTITTKVKVELACTSQLTASTAQAASIDEISKTTFRISVSPNPAKDLVKVTINTVNDNNAQIMLFDLSGKVMMSDKINLTAGENIKTMNLGSYTRGMYILQVISNNNKETFKILLQ